MLNIQFLRLNVERLVLNDSLSGIQHSPFTIQHYDTICRTWRSLVAAT